MSLTKLSTVTVIPGTPAVSERPYSRYCPPPPLPGGSATSGTHGAAVSSYARTVTVQTCYSCPTTTEVELCTVYADGYTECVVQSVSQGGILTT